MKRLLFAMLCIVSALSASAWDGSEGKVYLQNVGSGLWWGVGNGWGTQASLMEHPDYVTLHLSDGVYTLESQVSNGGTAYYFNGDYMDNNTPVNLTITQSGDYWTIANGESFYGYDGSTTVLGKGVDATTDNGKWRIFTEAEMLANLENATEDNPVDATFLITDPNFGRNNRNVSAWTMVASNQNLSGGNNTNNCAESYHSVFTLSQAIANAPYGYYGLKGQAFYRQDGSDNDNLPYFYFNNEKVNFPLKTGSENSMSDASVSFTNGLYKTDELRVTHAGGSLTIGAKLEVNTSLWCIWDNFELTYYGPIDLSEFEAQLAAKVAEAEAVDANTIPTACYDNITAAVTANNKEYATADEYAAAIAAIDAAIIANTQADVIAAYSRYKTIRNAVVAISSSIDVTTADTEANAATTAAAIESAVGTVRAALAAYLPTVTLGDGEFLDLTDALLNNPAPGISGNTEYWTNSETPGLEFQLWEFYNKSGATTKQTIATTLPAGTYRLSAVAFTRTGYEAKLSAGEASTNIATVSSSEVNNRQGGNTWIAAGNGTTDLMFTLAEATSDLEIGLTAATTGDKWMCWRSFRLVYGNVFPAYTLATGKMNAEVEAAQTAAETAFTANKTVDTYNALATAIANAEASIAAYAVAKAAVDKANAIKEAHNFASEAATTTFTEAITNIEGQYNEGTLTDADANAAGTALGIAVTGWHGGNNNAAPVYLRDGFALGDFAADPALHVNTWSTEGDGDGTGFSVPFYESWTGDANSLPESTITGTLTDLPNGQYKISAWVRVRAKNETAAADATGITMDVNGGDAVDVTEGDQVGTSQFNIGTYEALGLVKQGTLTLNFNIAADANISWLSFQHVKYEFVRDLTPEEAFVAATEEDYAALNAAIEGKVLGFEAGEYAPYNNVEGVAAIAAAKAIDQTANNSQEDVQAATAAITNATWTANTAEVNAVYDGSFEADYSGQSGNINPTGWQRVKGAAADGYNVRLMNGTNAGLAATTSGKALFTKQSAYYGYANGYTMPLKANTMYKVTFVYGGWGDCKKDGYVSMAAPDGSAVTLSATDLPVDATNADADVNAWKSYEALFTTGEAGDYVLGLRKKSYDTSGQSQYVYGDIVIVKASADDIKDQLLAELNTANAIDTEANVGDAAFQIPATAATALTSEISDAQGVYDNIATATVADVLQAIEDLKAAEEAYKNAELNAPADGQLFNVVLTYAGWNYDNKAMTYIANGRTDQGNYNIQYKEVANPNLAQAFTFTKVEGNNYRMSQIDADGNVRYVTDGKTGYESGDGSGIRTTLEVEKAAAFKIIATSTDGVYNIWNNVKGQYIGSQDAGVYTVNSHIDFQLVETQKPSITINTTAAGWGTTMLPFAVASVPEGVKVYSCAGADGATLTLEEVETLEANKPYIIEGAWNETLTGDAQGTALTYTEGLLTGTYAKMAAPNGCYILQKQGEKVGFFKVDTSVAQPNVGANRAYLTAPAGSEIKAFDLGGDTDGINSLVNDLQKGDIYDLAGRKVQRMQKGNVYIVNGKKVVVK